MKNGWDAAGDVVNMNVKVIIFCPRQVSSAGTAFIKGVPRKGLVGLRPCRKICVRICVYVSIGQC